MLTVYSKPNCPFCVKAKTYLSRHGIGFNEVDVTQDASALAFLKSNQHNTVPQIYDGKTLFVEGGCSGLLGMPLSELKARAGS